MKPLYKVDRLLTTLRWVLLAAALVLILLESRTSNLPVSLLALIVIAAIGNLLVVISLTVDVSPRPVPLLTLAGDTLLAVLFLGYGNGSSSPLLFYSLFPILISALRFSWRHNGVVSGLIIGTFFATKILGAQNRTDVYNAIGPLILLGLTALISGMVSSRVKDLLLQSVRAEAEGELRQLRTRSEQARAIFEMASTLNASLNYERILDAVLDVGAMGLREFGSVAQRLVSVVLLFGKERQLEVRASRRLTARDEAARLAGTSGVIVQALQSAEPQICNDPKHDPELAAFVSMHRCVTAIIVPLRAGFETYGVAVFGSPEPNVFTPDHIELLSAVASQAIIGLQNAQLYQRLQEEKNRIVDIEEDARKKLARDLHDGPTQSVAAIAMRLNFTRTLLKRSPTRVDDELEKIEELARKTTKEIRHMLFTLRPLVLETQGLIPALEQYVQKLKESDDSIEIILDVGRWSDRLNKDAQGVIFYIIEEAVSNARKHSQAHHLWIRLHENGGELQAEVRDDGVGFEVMSVQATYDKRGSLGMINMEERTQLVGGTLSVASAPGQGTRISLNVPLK